MMDELDRSQRGFPMLNPFTEMLRSPDPQHFVHRGSVDSNNSVIDNIIDGVTRPTPCSFSISGNRKLGKSYLIQFLRNPTVEVKERINSAIRYRPDGTDATAPLFIHVDLYRCTGEALMQTIYRSVVQTVKAERDRRIALDPTNDVLSLPDLDKSVDLDHKSTGREALRDLCESYWKKSVRLVICLDHANIFLDAEGVDREDEKILRFIQRDYQPFLILTVRSLHHFASDFESAGHSPWFSSEFINMLTPVRIGLMNMEEARALVNQPGVVFQPNEVEFLLHIAGCHPFLLTLACEYFMDFCMDCEHHGPRSRWMEHDQRQWLMKRIAELPRISLLLRQLWQDLSVGEKELLARIAEQGQLNAYQIRSSQTRIDLTELRDRSLVREDNFGSSYVIFSGMFRYFVQAQRSMTSESQDGMPTILESLPPLDRRLLNYFIAHAGQICTLDDLRQHVWESEETTQRSIEAAVHRLRRKIEDGLGLERDCINNIRGRGYKYTP